MHPRLFELGHFVLPTFAVLLTAGLTVALLVLLRTAHLLSLPAEKTWNLALLGILLGAGGARLLSAAADLRIFSQSAGARILKEESAVSAVAIAIVVCAVYARRTGLPFRRTADALAPAIAAGSALAWIGRLEAGSSYGTPTSLPWAVVYTSRWAPANTPLGVPLHPVQLYACIVQFFVFVLLLWTTHRRHRDGEIAGSWLFLTGLSGFLLSYLEGGMSSGLLGGSLIIAQTAAAAMVILGGALWLRPAEDARRMYAN